METKTYLSCADTAKLVRAALKTAFPGVKFSVRSSVYSMGASIDVSYTDGPPRKVVERVTNRFVGSDFDGSIDLATSRYHYRLPTGEIVMGGTYGTEGSRGYISERHNPMPEGATKVSLGADHIFVTRNFGPATKSFIAGRAAQLDAIWQDRSNDQNRWYAAEEFDFTPMLTGRKPTWRPGNGY